MVKCQMLGQRAFTYIEIIVVIGIFLILTGLVVPIGVRFYANQNLAAFSPQLAATLKRARFLAQNQGADSDYGVYIESDKYTVFQGSSFADRNEQFDETYYIPSFVTIEEEKEVVFEKMTGLPADPASIILKNNYQSNVISINSQGRVVLSLNVSLAGE